MRLDWLYLDLALIFLLFLFSLRILFFLHLARMVIALLKEKVCKFSSLHIRQYLQHHQQLAKDVWIKKIALLFEYLN